jgi:hypothetical protein
MKHTKGWLEKIETLYKELEYSVRYEKGNFNSGYCLVMDNKVVVINKFLDTESRINILVDILTTFFIEESRLSKASMLTLNSILREIKAQNETA